MGKGCGTWGRGVGHGVLTGPGTTTGREHPGIAQESQQPSDISALSLAIGADLQTHWFLKHVSLWLSWSLCSLLQL